MPFNGTGGFEPLPPPTYPAVAGEVIRAIYFNAVIDDIKTGLSQVLVRDGQAPVTGNVDLTGNRFTNAGDAVLSQEFTTLGQASNLFIGKLVATWQVSSDLKERFYFTNNGATDVRGHGATPIRYRNAANTIIGQWTDAGELQGSVDATSPSAFPRLSQVQALVGAYGELRYFHRSTAPTGFIEARGDQTIGNAASGATRANADTLNLFTEFWSNATTAIFDSAGVASVKGANAAADFAANKRLQVVEARAEHLRGWDNGRGIDTARVLGSYQLSQSNDIESFDTTVGGASFGTVNVPADGTWSAYAVTGDEGAPPNPQIAMKLYGRESRGRNLALLACWSLGAA